MIALAEKNDRAIRIWKFRASGTEPAVAYRQVYGITLQVKRDLHPEPIEGGQFLSAHACSNEITFSFLVESEHEVISLTVIEEVVDPVALFVFDSDDVADLCGRIECQIECYVEMA